MVFVMLPRVSGHPRHTRPVLPLLKAGPLSVAVRRDGPNDPLQT
jgi:hypothetical protein